LRLGALSCWSVVFWCVMVVFCWVWVVWDSFAWVIGMRLEGGFGCSYVLCLSEWCSVVGWWVFIECRLNVFVVGVLVRVLIW